MSIRRLLAVAYVLIGSIGIGAQTNWKMGLSVWTLAAGMCLVIGYLNE
jgi:hypothetical protein